MMRRVINQLMCWWIVLTSVGLVCGLTVNVQEDGEYMWRTGPWGSCDTTDHCGSGTQNRHIWCSHRNGRAVLEYLCADAPRPGNNRHCYVDCVTGKGKYRWMTGEWSPCTVHLSVQSASRSPYQEEECVETEGVTLRNVTCVRYSPRGAHLRSVVDTPCYRSAPKPAGARRCHAECPQDCVVGEFSDWSSCNGCDVVSQSRSREVLKSPRAGGRPCPPLRETRPCTPPLASCLRHEMTVDHRGDYKLKVGQFGECQLPGSVVPVRYGSEQVEEQSNDVEAQEALRLVLQPQVGYQLREVYCRDKQGERVERSTGTFVCYYY